MADAAERILIIEDDRSIQKLLQLYLQREGFDVHVVSDGENGLEKFRQLEPHIVILDLILPGLDGRAVCRHIRRDSSVPIIMLTARDALDERVEGLTLGADDYVTKPFEPRELVARIRAVLRRSGDNEEDEILRYGNLQIDPYKRIVKKGKQSVQLTAKEFDLLHLLAKNPSQVFTRDQLLDRVWGYEFYGNVRTVDVHIRHLRKKVECDPSNPQHIVTVWGVGYKFEPAEEEV